MSRRHKIKYLSSDELPIQNTNLLKKDSDYSLLKEELSSKTTEVSRLEYEIICIRNKSEFEIKTYDVLLKTLVEDLSKKELQLCQTRIEVIQLQATLTSEKSLWNKEKKSLEQEISEFKELHKTVIEKNEDLKEKIKNLQQTLDVLNYELTNKFINLTKSESVRPYKSNTSARTSLNSNTENLFFKSSAYLQPSNEKYDDSSMKFLSDAKNRCGKLKQEENVIQEEYSYTVRKISDFESYSFMPLSKSARQSEMSLPFSTNIHSSFSISNDNVTTLNTGTSKNLRKELSAEHSNQFSPHVAESDFSTPSQAENSHSQQLCGSVVLESKDQDPAKNSKKASTQKQNDLVKGNVDNSEHSQLESKSTEKNLPEELSPPSIHGDENTVSLSSVPRSIDSQSKSIVLENSKSASLYSIQEISDNKILEKTKSKPESSSLFVNLDAAWKQRS